MKSIDILSTSSNQTMNIAKTLAKYLSKGDTVVLTGELGSGKTKFTEGFLAYYGLEEEISSPTFNIVNEPGPISEISKSISERVRLVSSNICFIRGIRASECVKPLSKFISLIILVSSKIATPQILLEVVILKIFNLIPP